MVKSHSSRATSNARDGAIKSELYNRQVTAPPEHSNVLVSAVISTYLLTHLHHVLQRAEYRAQQDGRQSLAANYAQLRQLLCLDAQQH